MSMIGGVRVLAVLALAAAVSAGCSKPAADTADAGNQVSIEVVNIAYAPSPLEIEAGQKVTWTNLDEGVRHTVTSGVPGDNGVPGVSEGEPAKPDGLFAGDLPDASATFTFTFAEAGTFDYFCEVHPSMTGKVIVL